MCHHNEAHEWAALREELEAAEPDDAEAEPSGTEPTVEAKEGAQVEDRLPPIQPTD